MAIYTDGKLKASLSTEESLNAKISVGSGGGISKKQLEEALSTKADISHTHEEYLTSHQPLEHLALKEHKHDEYLTEQDISHLASTQYVNDSLKEKSDELILYANGVASMEAYSVVNDLRNNELINYATTTILTNYETESMTLSQDEFSQFIGELRTEIDELKSFVSSTVLNAEPLSNYYTEYKINNTSTYSLRNKNIDTVGSGGYLPECSNGKEFIKITLLDGNLTTDLNTRVSKVDSIKVYYPEETTNISFAETKVQVIDYINLEHVEELSFQNCQYLQEVNLLNSNSKGNCVTENTFENVPEECKITISKDWETTEEQAGFIGTYTNPWKYRINYTLPKGRDSEQYGPMRLYSTSFPTITVDENMSDESYNQDFILTEVYLTDGSMVTESFDQIIENDVDHIIVYYPQDTVHLKMPIGVVIINELIIDNFISLETMFSGCTYLKEIKGINSWDTTNISNMSGVFYECTSLTSLDLSGWNVENVTDMSFMFYNCNSLSSLEISSWNAANITEIFYMFQNCTSLTSLDLSGWNVENVESTYALFQNCTSLTSLDLSGWITTNLISAEIMFENCSTLTSLDLSGWNTENLASIEKMFYNCSSLTTLNLSTWNTSIVEETESYLTVFSGVPENIDWCYDENDPNSYANWTLTEEQTGFSGTFPWNKNPYYIEYTIEPLNDTDTLNQATEGENVELAYYYLPLLLNDGDEEYQYHMNYDGVEITLKDGSTTNDLNVLASDVSKVRVYYNENTITLRFATYDWVVEPGIKTVDYLKTDNFTTMYETFANCIILESINTDGWNTSKVTDMGYMFSCCCPLKSLDVSSFNTGNVIDMSGMFSSCESLTTLDLSSFDTSNVTNMSNMFGSCLVLETIDVSNWNTNKVTDMSWMFSGCMLSSLDLSNFNTSNVTNMSNMFDSCISLVSLDLSNFNTSNVTEMTSMFNGCQSLTEIIGLDHFNTQNVTIMLSMFQGCSSLTSLDLSNFNINNVTMQHIFNGCTSLKTINLSTWNTNVLMDSVAMSFAFTGVPEDVDWCYDENDPNSYANFTLTEEHTGFSGTFPWNKQEEEKLTVAKYTFTSTTDTLPTFNEEFTNYTVTDVVNGDGTTTRTISISKTDTLPSSISFKDKTALLSVEELDTSNVTNMAGMFWKCSSLKSVDLSNFNTSNVTIMSNMFRNCSSLTSLDLSNFNTSNVTNMASMFRECSSLTSLDLSNFNTSNVTTMNYMFYNTPTTVDWHYDGANYTNWTLTEEETGFSGTFPWNAEEETVTLTLIFDDSSTGEEIHREIIEYPKGTEVNTYDICSTISIEGYRHGMCDGGTILTMDEDKEYHTSCFEEETSGGLRPDPGNMTLKCKMCGYTGRYNGDSQCPNCGSNDLIII